MPYRYCTGTLSAPSMLPRLHLLRRAAALRTPTTMLASRQPRSIFMLGTSSKADLTVILSAAARTRSMSSKVVGSSGDMSAGAWMDLARNGSAPPLRFPLGTPVKCFVGTDEWLRGTVVAHNYREPSWPASQLSAPYQILLTDDAPPDARNAIWAPADVDEIIQSDFRFGLGEVAECRLGEHEWVLCTVVGLLYRELKWPEGQYAPYQVRVDGVLPGSVDERAKTLADKRQLIWLPRDADDCIKARSALREERLKALVALRQQGMLGPDEFEEKRRAIIHALDTALEEHRHTHTHSHDGRPCSHDH